MFKLKPKLLFLASSILAILLSFNACIKEVTQINEVGVNLDWNPDLAVPVLHARLSIMDFYASQKLDSILDIDQNDLIVFSFKAKDIRLEGGELFYLPEQSMQLGPLNSGLPWPDSGLKDVGFNIDDTNQYNLRVKNGVELSSVSLKAGYLKVTINSQIQRSGILYLDFPDMKDNGIPMSFALPFDYTPGQDTAISDSVNLRNYVLKLNNDTVYNSMTFYSRIEFDSDTTYIHWNDNVFVKVELANLEYDLVKGYFGQYAYNGTPDSLLIEFFKTVSTGKVQLADPKMDIGISNSIGVPIRIREPKISGHSVTGNSVNLTSSLLKDIDVPYPSLSQIGETMYDEYLFTKSNSNMADLLNVSPHTVIFDMPVSINPDQVTHDNFITDTSYMSISRDVILPFDGSTKAWGVEASGNIDLETPDLLEYLQLNLLVDNGLPVDVELQVYLADSNGVYLDSLFDGNHYVALSGALNTNGEVVKPTGSLSQVIFEKDRLDGVKDVKKVEVKAKISTADNGSKQVKILSNYVFDIKVGVRAKLRINE